ncbi:MAG: cyclic nucleotide-binding domain-containing protein [Erythrobacter sp.]
MIDLNAVEKMLALAAIAPFDLLKESELLLIARQTHRRTFSAGEMIFPSGQVPDVMIVATSGAAVLGEETLAPILGPSHILFGLSLEREVVAGSQGLEGLCLAKPHLFTLARECPDFIVGLAAMRDEGAS